MALDVLRADVMFYTRRWWTVVDIKDVDGGKIGAMMRWEDGFRNIGWVMKGQTRDGGDSSG